MGRPEKPEASVIAAQDLRAYIDAQDDFAFEREVYHKAQGLGMCAEHAGLYEDPITYKPRQFDIRATKTVADQMIALALECKGLSATYPLLVSCVPRSRAESIHEILYTENAPGAGGSHTRVAGKGGSYREGEAVGKSMRQIRRDSRGELTGGDEVFDKWMQALGSAAGLIEDAANLLSVPGPARPRYAAIVPVLVVSDETLWVADYAPNGRIKRDPFRVSEITFYLGRKYDLPREQLTFTVSHLHIYTRGHVHTLLQEITGGGEIWPKLFR